MRLRCVAAMLMAAAAAELVGCKDDEVCLSPTNLVVHSGDGQSGPSCAQLDQQLTVRVQCANNEPYGGSTMVEWQVESGGGSVDPSTSATDAAGRASTRLTLGPSPGEHVVRATVAGLEPATFTAEAIEPCSFDRPLPLGIRASGDLGGCDCQLSDGSYVDYYRFSVAAHQAVQIDLMSARFNAVLALFDAGGLIAADDDGAGGGDSRIRVIMRPGSYRVGANSLTANELGAYRLTAAPGSEAATGCQPIWVMPATETVQQLANSDCSSEGRYGDVFLIVLRADQTVTISMRAVRFDAVVCLVLLSTEGVACYRGSGTDARLVYTSPVDDFFAIVATTYYAGALGYYSLSVTGNQLETPGKQAPFGKQVPVNVTELNTRVARLFSSACQPKPVHRQVQDALAP